MQLNPNNIKIQNNQNDLSTNPKKNIIVVFTNRRNKENLKSKLFGEQIE